MNVKIDYRQQSRTLSRRWLFKLLRNSQELIYLFFMSAESDLSVGSRELVSFALSLAGKMTSQVRHDYSRDALVLWYRASRNLLSRPDTRDGVTPISHTQLPLASASRVRHARTSPGPWLSISTRDFSRQYYPRRSQCKTMPGRFRSLSLLLKASLLSKLVPLARARTQERHYRASRRLLVPGNNFCAT